MAFVWDWMIFLGVFISLLGLTLIILGLLTAYFGSGKTRAAGLVLALVGFLIPFLMYLFVWSKKVGYFTNVIFLPSLMYIGAGIIGVAIGFAIFLGIIMKT